MEENKEFEKVEVQEGQVEAGIEYNEVTTDDTVQDAVNEDNIMDETAENIEAADEAVEEGVKSNE